MVPDGAPLLADASIWDFQEDRAGYVANFVEQALLLPGDMADLRALRKHGVCQSKKRPHPRNLTNWTFYLSLVIIIVFF